MLTAETVELLYMWGTEGEPYIARDLTSPPYMQVPAEGIGEVGEGVVSREILACDIVACYAHRHPIQTKPRLQTEALSLVALEGISPPRELGVVGDRWGETRTSIAVVVEVFAV